MGKEILGIFFRVDIFDKEFDVVFSGDIRAALKGFDAVGVHFLGREARNFVSRLHNETGAFEFPHGGDEIAQGFEKGVAFGGIRQRNPYAAGAVNLNAEFALLAARLGKIFLFPILEFIDKLNGVIAGFGDLFKTLGKREIAVDGPEHHR